MLNNLSGVQYLALALETFDLKICIKELKHLAKFHVLVRAVPASTTQKDGSS